MSKVCNYSLYWSDKDLEDFQSEVENPLCGGDVVNTPSHYTYSKIETIDVIEAWQLGFHLSNVIKYISRAKHKGNELQDLKKALWYLQRHISNLENKE